MSALPSMYCFLLVNSSAGNHVGTSYLEVDNPFHLRTPSVTARIRIADLRDSLEKEQVFQEVKRAEALEHVDVRLVVCGGDGSVAWVLEEALRVGINFEKVVLGLIPIGTGNDLARTLGWVGHIPLFRNGDLNPLGELVEKWAKSTLHLMDVWEVEVKVFEGKSRRPFGGPLGYKKDEKELPQGQSQGQGRGRENKHFEESSLPECELSESDQGGHMLEASERGQARGDCEGVSPENSGRLPAQAYDDSEEFKSIDSPLANAGESKCAKGQSAKGQSAKGQSARTKGTQKFIEASVESRLIEKQESLRADSPGSRRSYIQRRFYEGGAIFEVKSRVESLRPDGVYRKLFTNYAGYGLDARVTYFVEQHRTSSAFLNKVLYGLIGFCNFFRKLAPLEKVAAYFTDRSAGQPAEAESSAPDESNLSILEGRGGLQETVLTRGEGSTHRTGQASSATPSERNAPRVGDGSGKEAPGGETTLQEYRLKTGFRGMLFLNVLSYMAGVRHMWHTEARGRKRDTTQFAAQSIGDGMLEVLCYRHELDLALERLWPRGSRVAQGGGSFELKMRPPVLGKPLDSFVEVDGESLRIRDLERLRIQRSLRFPNGKVRVMVRS